jgi:hypothetical protein
LTIAVILSGLNPLGTELTYNVKSEYYLCPMYIRQVSLDSKKGAGTVKKYVEVDLESAEEIESRDFLK